MARTVLPRLLLLIYFLLWSVPSFPAEERRVALVVGVSHYAHAPALAHTLDDAHDMAGALKRLRFDVDLVLDPDRAALESAVKRLGRRSIGADVSLLYYSGHALESQGINWIVPASADVTSERDLRFEALDLGAVLEQTQGLARMSLIFLDACRDDLFKQRLTSTRELTQGGLANVSAAFGTYLAFAAAPGMVAEDGIGLHSPFTGAMLKYIKTPGLGVRQLLSPVRRELREIIGSKQVSWDISAIEGDFYFNPKPTDPVPTVAKPDPNLLAALSVAAPTSSPKAREALATGYQSKKHKAIAANAATGAWWQVTGRANEKEAEEDALEACEVYNGVPCAVVALDDEVREEFPPREMPYVHYAGPFDPARIPKLQQGDGIFSYASAPSSKAAAYHPVGKLFIVTGAATQRAAEEQALSVCNGDPTRNGRGGSCYLYSANNEVVLSRHSKIPITPVGPAADAKQGAGNDFLLQAEALAYRDPVRQRLADAPPSTPVEPKRVQTFRVPSAAAVSLKDGLRARLSAVTSGGGVGIDDAVESYVLQGAPKAIAAADAAPFAIASAARLPTAQEAAIVSLERCQILQPLRAH
jgi:hypothetical protein